MQLSPRGQKFLKFAHIFTASCWLAGNITMLTLSMVKLTIDDPYVLLGVNIATMQVDIVVVICLGALGCLFTGLLYSLTTAWGFFNHRWITVKWVLTIVLIAYGSFFLGPWKSEMLIIHKEVLDGVFENARYTQLQMMHLCGSPFQAIGVLFLTYISIMKPWRKNMHKTKAVDN